NTGQSAGPLTATATVYTFYPESNAPGKAVFKKQWQKSEQVDYLVARHTRSLFPLPDSFPDDHVCFLRLALKDQNHSLISTNTYTLSSKKDMLDEGNSTWYITPQSQYADLTGLQSLPA